MKPKPFVEDFHPFLQAINTKKNEGHLHVNSENFRYDEITKEKPKDTYRVFVLGGSTVYDEWHAYEKSLVKQIEDSLRKHYPNKKIQVINAGYSRYTSEHSLILYQTKISDFDPDLIVIWQGFNDMYQSCNPGFLPKSEYKSDYSHFYEVLSNVVNNYFNYQIKFYVAEKIIKSFTENYYSDLRSMIKPAAQTPQRKYEDINFPSLQAYVRNMNYIVKLAKSDNVPIIIGNQANQYADDPRAYGLGQYYCNRNGIYASQNSLKKGIALFNNASKKIAEEQNIPFIDIDSKLPKTWRYFKDDAHYTDEGNKIVADTVYGAIVKSGYLEKQ